MVASAVGDYVYNGYLKGSDTMAYGFLSTVQTVVRRLNGRVETLVKNLGADSPVIKDIGAQYDLYFRNNYAFKGDTPVLKRPAEIYNDKDMSDKLQELERNIKTYAELKKSYKGKYETYKEQAKFFKVKPKDINTFMSEMEGIDRSFDWIYQTLSPEAKVELKRKKDAKKQLKKFTLEEKGGKRKKGQKMTYEDMRELVRTAGVYVED